MDALQKFKESQKQSWASFVPFEIFTTGSAAKLVRFADINRGQRVLDVACGTGVVARAASERVGRHGRVVGVDLNPGMIAVAQSLPATDGAPIEWLERSALNLGLDDASFDVVLCQQGLQFFPDKAAALREMRRVLGNNGRLALSVWNNVGIYNTAVSSALAQFMSSDIAARFNASRKVPSADELKYLAIEAGFSAVRVTVSCIDIDLPHIDKFVLDHLAATPVASSIGAATAEARKKIGNSAKEQLQRYAHGGGITYPEETHVLTAKVN